MRYAMIDLLGEQGPTRVDAYDYLRLSPQGGVASLEPVCPFCEEFVYHVKRMDDIQFFSHYPKTDESPECDLRNWSISSSVLYRVAEERAVTLGYLRNFEETLERYIGTLDRSRLLPRRRRQVQNLCKNMPANWYLVKEIKTAFCFKSVENIFPLSIMIAPFLFRAIPALLERNAEYLYDEIHRRKAVFIWRCLHIPRERSNLRYLLELTLQFLERNSIRLSEESSRFNEEIIFWSFCIITLVPW